MNKKSEINFETLLKEARENFKLLGVYFEEVVYSRPIVLEANEAAKRINGTIEANVLEAIRYSMRKNAIVSLRKIFEKSDKDKKSNIDHLIKFLKKYKKEVSLEHFRLTFKEYANTKEREYTDTKTNRPIIIVLSKKEQKRYRLEYAKNEEKFCLESIDELYADWIKYFTTENLKKLIDNRTVLAHSIDISKIQEFEGLSFDSIKEYLDQAEIFMNRIDDMLNRNKTSYESFHYEWKNAADKFWQRLN